MVRSPLFGDSGCCIFNPSGSRGASALTVIERDLDVKFNVHNCIQSGQRVHGWDAQLEEILANGLVGATEHTGLTVGGTRNPETDKVLSL